MNKLDILKQAKENIQRDGVIDYQYVGVVEGKECFCAVGHLMNVCGMDLTLYREDKFYNGEPVYLIQDDFIPLIDKGFSISELEILQKTNDAGTQDEVLLVLDKMIMAEVE
jgi:hypothetical protein